jgi:hypothetical protein
MKNIDLSTAQDVNCDGCGNSFFESAFAIKRVSVENSPTGKAGVIPIPVFVCKKCGHINEEFSLTDERLRQTNIAPPPHQG